MSEQAPNVKLYLAIFGALMFFTVVTVLVSYWHLTPFKAVLLGMAIASFKAWLVGAFFMHLKGEHRLIYGMLALTLVFLIILFSIPISDSQNLEDRRLPNGMTAQAEEAAH